MGFFADQEGIFRRYVHEGDNWSEHLENTKRAITEFIRKQQVTSLSIFGSGWMLDIPVDILSGETKMVVFYDIRHPQGILDKYGGNTKFRFIEADLTGGLIDKAYRICNQKQSISDKEITEELIPEPFELPVRTDFYISLNILNQLDILLIDYLRKKAKMSSETEGVLKKRIQRYHLNMMKKGYSCLITDTEELHIDDNERILGTIPLIYTNLPAYSEHHQWIWKFDTRRTYHHEYKTYMQVKTLYF